jgi:hypothetical protein
MNEQRLSTEVAGVVEPSQPSRAERIRALNDQLRQSGRGGTFCVTGGVASLEWTRLVRVMDAVVEFDAFGPDNDPRGEHDCAIIEVAGVSVIWKVDYYDLSLIGLSPDPADPSVTRRILTIMLASEY